MSEEKLIKHGAITNVFTPGFVEKNETEVAENANSNGNQLNKEASHYSLITELSAIVEETARKCKNGSFKNFVETLKKIEENFQKNNF